MYKPSRRSIRRRDLEAQQRIVADGDRPTDCCLLFSGFAYRAKTIIDGRRQVLSLHIPGEIPDMQSLHLHVMDHDLIMMTPCVVGLISHDAVKALRRAQPAVADAFWRKPSLMLPYFGNGSSMWAHGLRMLVAHLLMELYRRLEVIGRQRMMNSSFRSPRPISAIAWAFQRSM